MTDQTQETPNEVPAVPDHERPAWLREEARVRRLYYGDAHVSSAALSLLADVIDVCGREDVEVQDWREDHPFDGPIRFTLFRRSDGTSGRGPTLTAAVRAFKAAEQEARNVSP